jgi:hypothetical protein
LTSRPFRSRSPTHRARNVAPPMVARALAVAHTCMYDPWAAYDRVALGTRFAGALRQPPARQTLRNKHTAISFAAYRAASDPHWLHVTPFALPTGDDLRSPTGPARYGTPAYESQATQLVELGQQVLVRVRAADHGRPLPIPRPHDHGLGGPAPGPRRDRRRRVAAVPTLLLPNAAVPPNTRRATAISALLRLRSCGASRAATSSAGTRRSRPEAQRSNPARYRRPTPRFRGRHSRRRQTRLASHVGTAAFTSNREISTQGAPADSPHAPRGRKRSPTSTGRPRRGDRIVSPAATHRASPLL